MLPRLDKITYDEVRDDLVAYYQTRGTRDLNEAKGRLIHIDAYFNGRRLVTVTPALITTYVQARQARVVSTTAPRSRARQTARSTANCRP